MATYPLNATATGTINAQGTASVSIGPSLVREQWDVTTTTVTSLGMTITVSQFGSVIDSTANDPRPTVTDSTQFQLMSGNQITVKWTGGTPGQGVAVSVTGTRRTPGGADAVR